MPHAYPSWAHVFGTQDIRPASALKSMPKPAASGGADASLRGGANVLVFPLPQAAVATANTLATKSDVNHRETPI
jgi:hypothetical protein